MIKGLYDGFAASASTGANPQTGSNFDQGLGLLAPVMPVAPAGSTPVRCTSCCTTLGEDVVLQFGGGTIGHPMGIAPARRRTALPFGGNDQRPGTRATITYSEGPDILRDAAKGCPELDAPLRSGRTSRSTLSRPTPLTPWRLPRSAASPRNGEAMRITQGRSVSGRPDRRGDRGQIRYALQNAGRSWSSTQGRSTSSQTASGTCGISRSSTSVPTRADVAMRDVDAWSPGVSPTLREGGLL